MSHNFQISDEVYIKLATYAQQHNQTPEALFDVWVNEIIHRAEQLAQVYDSYDSEIFEEIDMEELRAKHPILQISGIFSIDEPGWADRHDEYFAGLHEDRDDHAER